MSEALGWAGLIGLTIYGFFFDGFRVILGTAYTLLGG